jgi:hypothetical protein
VVDHGHSKLADPRRGVADLAGHGRKAQAPFWVLPEPKVLLGDDVGFRVEGVRGKVPTGVMVIKVNGKLVRGAGRGAEADQVTVATTE